VPCNPEVPISNDHASLISRDRHETATARGYPQRLAVMICAKGEVMNEEKKSPDEYIGLDDEARVVEVLKTTCASWAAHR
jgi:hypothetical protein